MSDIEIARKARKQPILELAREQFGIAGEHLEPYGHYKAKLSLDFIDELSDQADGQLILVTAVSPTPAGEGKTTTTVGLGDAMNRLGRKTLICLREPSLGPCFGIKGGAAGGGRAQVVPMEDINLHFTGDFHAIGAAHNLLAAMVDNHIHQGNALDIDPRRVTWKRVVDMNDRALRQVVVALGGPANGFPREGGFDITVASEVMAIFCLATSLADLRERLGNIVIGHSRAGQPVQARDLNAHGAMAALLRDAVKPNLVQTLENNLALVHGGPFANIAHGCNTVTATRAALKLADCVITEAGFGADLGAEKFIDIKCRMSGLKPAAAVLVATVRALKYHGGMDRDALHREDLQALERGMANLHRHLDNIRQHYGLPCLVCINHFTQDRDRELRLVQSAVEEAGAPAVVSRHWAEGGAGAEPLARQLLALLQQTPSAGMRFVYPDSASPWQKIEAVANKIYGAGQVTAPPRIRRQLEALGREHPDFPVCIAKTQMSFSTDPALRGAPSGHVLEISELRLARGAGFIVAVAGSMMTMPGLPKSPAAEQIDVDGGGNISGLF